MRLQKQKEFVSSFPICRYMTIHKQPDVVGVMKFRRYVDGKVVEQMETSSIDFDQAESMAKTLDK